MRREEFGLASPPDPVELRPGENLSGHRLPWIQVAGSYFVTETGEPWTPIGQNDSISWVEFDGLFRRKDIPSIERHLAWLAAHGVTCLRFMMEYAQVRHRYFERPMGTYVPNMVQLWDDLFALCEKHGLRILLTPFDTYWTWVHWRYHPYNRKHGGCLDKRSRILLCPHTREAIKARLTFAVERWGGSGALFAWDLWNEIHPAHADESADVFPEFIHDLSQHVRELETRLYGRAHPQTVSLFGPELRWRSHMELREPIFRHPDLDFASIHIYREGAIDSPRDTVAAALAFGEIVRDCLAETHDGRPFFDSEHGPIHSFKDKHKTLPAAFDDEYFRHMQWAHLASGGAGGGMRWPNRKPHVLTPGMRFAQHCMSKFLPEIDWPNFRRKNLNEEIGISDGRIARFGCGDENQALIWLVRRDTLGRKGTVDPAADPVSPTIRVPGLSSGDYSIAAWDTAEGVRTASWRATSTDGWLETGVSAFSADTALAVRRV